MWANQVEETDRPTLVHEFHIYQFYHGRCFDLLATLSTAASPRNLIKFEFLGRKGTKSVPLTAELLCTLDFFLEAFAFSEAFAFLIGRKFRVSDFPVKIVSLS
ncbi:hypothetical protein V6N11_033559 [Hibiscus sabdariffa]|uniref:Uncharacterized protein n=1 Tax=Hibiscus sabdariffa TaxID=183260 RepID=A0ABR2PYH8_9ROSI